MPTHQELDQRSLALHQLVAEKIRQDAALFDKAQAVLNRWRETASPRGQGYLESWQSLMDQGVDACLTAATQNSQWGDAMRQASPLACLLTNQERFSFLKHWKEAHAAQ
jgi:hypothetical protein